MNNAAPKVQLGSAPGRLPPVGTLTRSEQETQLVVLPDPVGYQMLVALPTAAEKTESGIYIPYSVNERERAATVVGTVLAMGDLCYRDIRRFGYTDDEGKVVLGKPWCKVGDTILFSRYSGMRFKSMDPESGDMVEYRMLSDDQIVGTVPSGAKVGGL